MPPNRALPRRLRRLSARLELVLLALASGLVAATPSWATGTTTAMPWETPLQTVANSLSGPVAKWLGIIAIIMTGLGFAVAESGSVIKRGVGIVFGLALAFSATTFMSSFFSITTGAGF